VKARLTVRTSFRQVDYSVYRYLRVSVVDGLAEVVLKSRHLDARGHWEVSEIIRDLDRDTDVRASLMYWPEADEPYAAEPDMLPGTDLPGPERFTNYEQGMREAREGIYNAINANKPSVSAFQGELPIGGHFAVMMLADITVVDEAASLCDSHVSMAIPSGDHSCLWPASISLAQAKRLMLAGDAISGREAERIGLISVATPADQVLSTARAYAQKLASQPRNAVRLTKRALNQYLKQAGLVAFDISLAFEQLGLLDGDLDTLMSRGLGVHDHRTDAVPFRLPSDVHGDRSHAS
jgi:enoyl-CoA hydratase